MSLIAVPTPILSVSFQTICVKCPVSMVNCGLPKSYSSISPYIPARCEGASHCGTIDMKKCSQNILTCTKNFASDPVVPPVKEVLPVVVVVQVVLERVGVGQVLAVLLSRL